MRPNPPIQALTEAFAVRALARLREAGESIELAQIWSDLCSGELSIAELLSTGTSSIALFRRHTRSEAAQRAIRGRRLDVLERVLGGQSLKFIALEIGLSVSTVSTEFRRAAAALGVGGPLSQVPVLLAQLRNANNTKSELTAASCLLEPGDSQYLIVAVPRSDLQALERLPPAEIAVYRLLLEGHSHAQIAYYRDTSPRTIANQVSSIFRKLGVSGRLDLVTTVARQTSAYFGAGEAPNPAIARAQVERANGYQTRLGQQWACPAP